MILKHNMQLNSECSQRTCTTIPIGYARHSIVCKLLLISRPTKGRQLLLTIMPQSQILILPLRRQS